MVECHLHTVEVTGSSPVRPILKQLLKGLLFFYPKTGANAVTQSLTIDDLFRIERLLQIALAPDGASAWLCTKRINLETNSSQTLNYLLNCDSGELLAVELHAKGARDLIFSPDGGQIFFAADGQIYKAKPDGQDITQVTTGIGGASNPVPSSNGDRVLFAREVYTDPETQKTAESSDTPLSLADIYKLSHPLAKARTADALLYRHWDSWKENRRSHLFIVETATGQLCDLTPEDADVPPLALESSLDYAFSPDGRYVAYVKNPDSFVANSTNNSIFLQAIEGIQAKGEAINISDTQGCDNAPSFLSSNKLAYCSMLTPGYEADAVRLKVYDLESKKTRLYLEDFERSVDQFALLTDNSLLIRAQDFLHSSLYVLKLDSGDIEQLTAGRSYTEFAIAPQAARILAILESISEPPECVEIRELESFPLHLHGPEITSDEIIWPYTSFGSVLENIELDAGSPLWYEAADKTPLQGCVVLPPNYDPNQKYPLILLIHGGPQGAFLDNFHYRWNAQMFASKGAVVAFCNPRGSTGYGHQITRDISQRWSDECPDDILRFLDATLAAYPSIDPNRLTAAGASFGGYMINHFLGHTDRFKAFVSHDGIFNVEMSGYITDELWFTEREFGAKPYEAPENYHRHSPHRHVSKFKTPTLVVQGEQDFRCFISEGVALFTALQYMNVPSRLLYFPTEGHWVLEPANAALWYDEVIGWLMKYANA